jgi:hypothetical protein
VTPSDNFSVHWLANLEVPCVISALIETFIMVILGLQRGNLVSTDFKPHLI